MKDKEWFVSEGAKVCLARQSFLDISPRFSEHDLLSQISYWNRYAVDNEEGYESDTQFLKWVAPAEMARMLSPYLQDGQEVLDVGCGSGLVKEAFDSRGQVKDLIFDGVDFSANMLAKAKQRNYRNLVCANIAQGDLAHAVWDDLGSEKKYSALVSVGVYSDFINQFDLPYIFDLADEHAVVAVAGRADKLSSVPNILSVGGFEMVHHESGVAHYCYSPHQDVEDMQSFFTCLFNPRRLPNPKLEEVNYSYFIGKR